MFFAKLLGACLLPHSSGSVLATIRKVRVHAPWPDVERPERQEQAAERLRDGYADYFSSYDALVTHVLPIPAHKHGVEEFVIDGRTVDATYLQGATVPLNVSGLPGVSMRFGTSSEGLPINVQIVGKWQAESTILHVASLLESVSPTRGLRPHL